MALHEWARSNLQLATSQEIGRYVGDMFADKRALVASIIEHQFAQIRRGDEISLHVMNRPPRSAARAPTRAEKRTARARAAASRIAAPTGRDTLATVATSGSTFPAIRYVVTGSEFHILINN